MNYLFINFNVFIIIQKQRNLNDCGLHAIANLMTICNDQRPEEQRYEQHKMRDHLKMCLEMGVMRHFPSRVIRRDKVSTRKQEALKVYCRCRLPEGDMINCDRCHEWFHSSCIDAPDSAWIDCPQEWFCDACI